MKYGPVDVLVVATGEPRFDGTVLGELAALAAAGTIRVLDAMILVKGPDGEVAGLDIEDLPADDRATLGFIETGTRGLFNAEDSATLTEGMVEGSAVLALAIENAWAVGLMNALADAGAEVAVHSRVPAVVVDDLLSGLTTAE